jgi:hypothetical protein
MPNQGAALLRRVPHAAWVLLATAALLVPGLGRFGLWEPWESDLAMRTSAAANHVGHALVHLGQRLGGGEAGLRAPFVALALATALVVHWGAVGIHGRRPALLSVAVLISLPLFSLQARQLTSDMPAVLALALATAGMARLAWPTPGARSPAARAGALVAAVAGVGLGLFAGGALVGVLAPCAALAGAALIEPPVALGRRAVLLLVGASAAAAVLVATLVLGRPHVAGVDSVLLGGAPRLGGSGQTFEALVRQAGFGLFPWSALAFFALGRGFCEPADGRSDETGPRAPEGSRAALAGTQLFLLLITSFVVVLSTLRAHLVGDVRFVALAPVALALGVFLDEALSGRRRDHRDEVTGSLRDGAATPTSDRSSDWLVGLLAAVGTVVVARDLYLAPEELASLHTLAKVRWPIEVGGTGILLAIGLGFAAAATVGLVLRRPAAIAGALGIALLFAVVLTHRLVPALSRHLSRRTVVDAYRRAATGGEALARYGVDGQGAAAWQVVPGPVLENRAALVSYLRRPGRSFALVAAGELAAVDEAIKLAGGSYAVLDASSRLLLLTSRLAPGEKDSNPLARSVWTPPGPDSPARPPWPAPRVAASTVFGDAVELVGADFPSTVRRPGSLSLALVFRVRARPPSGYAIFVHLEQPGESLINGDHEPVGGVFPTARWLPGEYVRDEHTIELPLEVTGSPSYRLMVGLWPGGNKPRLPITAGASDGADRCPLGTVTVR